MSDVPAFITPVQGQQTDNTVPRFHIKAVQNNFRTEQEGRPIFEDFEYVEIWIPGDQRSVVDRRVKPDDRARWPNHYAAFKAEKEYIGEGLPLAEWSAVTRSQVEEMKHFKIFTVEQLANLSDAQLQGSFAIGGTALREQARAYVATAAGQAPTAKLIADGLAKDATITELKEQMTAMQAQIAALAKET